MAHEYVVEKLDGVDFVEVDRRKSKHAAERLAEQTRASDGVTTRVVNEDGKVLADLPVRARPYTRRETDWTLSEAVSLPDGYTPAYQRKRIHTLVLRADDRSGYLLLNTQTGATIPASGTVDARDKTNKLRSGELRYSSSSAA